MAYTPLAQSFAQMNGGKPQVSPSSSSSSSNSGYTSLAQSFAQMNTPKPKASADQALQAGANAAMQIFSGIQSGKIAPNSSGTIQNGVVKPIVTNKPISIGDNIHDFINNPVASVQNKIVIPLESLFPSTTKAIQSFGLDPLSLKNDPIKSLQDWFSLKPSQDALQAVQSAANQEGKSWSSFVDSITNPSQKKLGAGAELVGNSANLVFSPISSFFNSSTKLPIVGAVTKLLGVAFTAAGEGASVLTNKGIDMLHVPQQAKDSIKPGIDEIVSLASQILLTHGMGIGAAKMGDLMQKFGTKDASTIVTQAEQLAAQKQNQITEGEKTPQEVINHVMSNNLENTPEGKAAIKAATEAQQAGQTITVSKQEFDNSINVDQIKTANEQLKLLPSTSEITKLQDIADRAATFQEGLDRSTQSAASQIFSAKSFSEFVTNVNRATLVYGNEFKDLQDMIKSGKLNENNYEQIQTNLDKNRVQTSEGNNTQNTQSQIGESSVTQDQNPNTEINTEGRGGTSKVGIRGESESINTGNGNSSSDNTKTNSESKNISEPQLSDTAKSKLTTDIEKRLNTEFKDVPGYEKMNMKDQATKATDLIQQDPKLAKDIAMGHANAPEDLEPGAVFTAVREKAMSEGDIETLTDLAKTDLAGKAGQALKAYDTFKPEDAVKNIKEVMNQRAKAVESKTGTTLDKAVQKEVNKIKANVKPVNKKTWQSFVDAIAC